VSLAVAGRKRQTVQTARRLAKCSNKWSLRQETSVGRQYEKNVFYVFYSCHVFRLLTFFYFVNVFYLKKTFLENSIKKFEKHF